MIINKKIWRALFLFFCVSGVVVSFAQDTSNADGLMAEARKAAFDKKDYPAAKAFLYKALKISPDYADVRIFLGRVYVWTKDFDSARICFQYALKLKPDSEDAFVAYTDLEYFADNFNKALAICRSGLQINPASEELMLREAKILNAQNHKEEAERALQKLLLVNGNNAEAKALANTLREEKNISKPDSVIIVEKTIDITNEDSLSSDGLLVMARKAAFDDKNYALAKYRLYKALAISPDYADIKVFLGRLHTWSDNKDSARYYFSDVLRRDPCYEDASTAWADLEYWNDDNKKALAITDSALVCHPASENLLVKRAKILYSLKQYAEAQATIDKALTTNRNSTEARSLSVRIRESASLNKIGFSYDFVKFDKQFADPWHLVGFDYTRTTGIGSVTGRINYANRFLENGVQYELEAYPHISDMFYSYVSVGYSDNVGVFPHWRGGLSLYANLPKSFEGELGIRMLRFSGDPVYIYTGYLGKYYKSWLFTGRTYITPSTFTKTVSASYSIGANYYFGGGADDVISATLGHGISPDDRQNSIQLDNTIRLISYKAGLSFKKKVSKYNVANASLSWFNQEYLPQTKGNQYQISIGWLHRF